MKKIICICSATLLLLTGCATKDPCKEGHTWTDATCKEPKTCQVCNITEGIAVEHSYSEYTIITEPTCAENGKEEAACIWCETKDQRELPKLEHSTEWEITTPATSSSEGVKSLKCQVCGEITSTEKIPKEPPKTTTQNNPTNSSSQSKNNGIGTACDYVNSAISDIAKANKIFKNIGTICLQDMVDDNAYKLYDDAIVLLKSAKTKIKSANEIFNNYNSNYRFIQEVNNTSISIQYLDNFIFTKTKPYDKSSLYGLAVGNQSIIDDIIMDCLYDIRSRMIDMGY